ncbi:MAG: hypothetical protein R3F26_00690 [Gammaproteobacteria bacterium]|nr:hypothetical protein [Pseudomonadales bacterium]MCP5358250.1 hypothetical protein [Pseudomonadales bacterium]
MTKLKINKADLMILRPAVIVLLLGLVFFYGSSVALRMISESTSAALVSARNSYQQINEAIQRLTEEESDVVRYSGRYRTMVDKGVFDGEDRLAVMEVIGRARVDNNLFPISVEMAEQQTYPLDYPPEELFPGDPVALHLTDISLRIPLLHEGDLLRVISPLIEGPGLLVPMDCKIILDEGVERLLTVRENMRAECQIKMITFDLNPAPVDEYVQ